MKRYFANRFCLLILLSALAGSNQLWAYPDLTAIETATAEAKAMGLSVTLSAHSGDVEIVHFNGGYPAFILVQAEVPCRGETDYKNLVFFKRDASTPLKLAFEHGHPGLGIIFSPSGKWVLLQNYYAAAHEESYVLPVSTFDSINDNGEYEVKPYWLVFRFKKPAQGLDFDELIKTRYPLMAHCGHLFVTGEKWLDDERVETTVTGDYCDKKSNYSNEFFDGPCYRGVINVRTRTIEKIKQTRKGTIS